MVTNYVLIDFENVQPRNLEILSNHPFKVFVFVGASQAKIPFELAAAMQHLGDDAGKTRGELLDGDHVDVQFLDLSAQGLVIRSALPEVRR